MMTFTLVALVGVAFVAGFALASMIANTEPKNNHQQHQERHNHD